MGTRRRLALGFAILGFLAALWLAMVGCWIWIYGQEDRARVSDCAIVLGAAVHGQEPSPVFEERIRHALHLYQEGVVARIVFTGGYGEGAVHAESEVGARYAMESGVPGIAIHTETESRTTRENLLQARAIMEREGLRSAVIVSDPLHLKRAALMAQGLGMSAATSPTPTTRYRTLVPKLKFLAREVYFCHHYFFLGG